MTWLLGWLAYVMLCVLAGMNVEVDEAAEERKGGAGHLGKMLLSAGDKTVMQQLGLAWMMCAPCWCCSVPVQQQQRILLHDLTARLPRIAKS